MIYRVVTSDNDYDLEESVCHYLSKGYELQGGVSVSGSSNVLSDTIYAQALVYKKSLVR